VNSCPTGTRPFTDGLRLQVRFDTAWLVRFCEAHATGLMREMRGTALPRLMWQFLGSYQSYRSSMLVRFARAEAVPGTI